MVESVDVKHLHNPYDFGNPVSDPNLFSGRERTLGEIRYYLDQAKQAPRPINIALLGSRAAGKTSLLNMIEFEATSRGMCAARINLNEGDTQSEFAFFYKIFDGVFSAVCDFRIIDTEGNEKSPFGGKLGKTYQTYLDLISAYEVPEDKTWCPFIFPIQYAKAMSSSVTQGKLSDQNFTTDLVKIRNEIKTPIVILFDECNVLANHRILLQMVRNIFMNTPGYMLVFTGTQDLFPVMDDVFSPIIRQFKKIEVGSFENTEETKDCIEKPLKSIGIDELDLIFDKKALNELSQIHDLTGGRPYEIQLLCHLMFKRVQLGITRKMELDLDILDDVLNELKRGHDISVRPIITKIRDLNPEQMSAFSFLTSCNGHATLDQLWFIEHTINDGEKWSYECLKQHLDHFTEEGILIIDLGVISFAGDDFDRIYSKYYARQRKVNLGFSDWTPEQFFNVRFSGFVHKTGNFQPISPFLPIAISMGNNISEESERPRRIGGMAFATELVDIFSVVESLSSNLDFNEICRTYPTLVESLYWLFWETEQLRRLTINLVNVYVSMNSAKLNLPYFVSHDSDPEKTEACLAQLRAMRERARTLGGDLIVKHAETTLLPSLQLLQRINDTNNSQLINSIVGNHHTGMVLGYASKVDLVKAKKHADYILSFNTQHSSNMLNNLGYIMLANLENHRARALFVQSIEQAKAEHEKPLPYYNLGIIDLKEQQFQAALEHFETALTIMQGGELERYKGTILFVPQIEEDELIYVEDNNLHLFETTQKAIKIVESLLQVN